MQFPSPGAINIQELAARGETKDRLILRGSSKGKEYQKGEINVIRSQIGIDRTKSNCGATNSV